MTEISRRGVLAAAGSLAAAAAAGSSAVGAESGRIVRKGRLK